MNIIFIFLIIIVIWHFLYEGIIAPSIRIHLRNKLFVIRDELRQVKADGLLANDERAFWFVHEGVNNFLNRLPNLTIWRSKELVKEYTKNEKLRKLLDDHVNEVRNSDARIRLAFQKTNSIIEIAVITNFGGYFIYLIPIVIVISIFSKISQYTGELLVAPTKDVERLIPKVSR